MAPRGGAARCGPCPCPRPRSPQAPGPLGVPAQAQPGPRSPRALTQIPGFPPSQVPGLLRSRLAFCATQVSGRSRAPVRAGFRLAGPGARITRPARCATYTARGRGKPAPPPPRHRGSWRQRAPHAASATCQGPYYRRGTFPPAPLGGRAAADVEGPSMLSGGGEAAAALTCRRAQGSAMSAPHNTAVLGSSGFSSARSFLPPVTARIGLMSPGSVP